VSTETLSPTVSIHFWNGTTLACGADRELKTWYVARTWKDVTCPECLAGQPDGLLLAGHLPPRTAPTTGAPEHSDPPASIHSNTPDSHVDPIPRPGITITFSKGDYSNDKLTNFLFDALVGPSSLTHHSKVWSAFVSMLIAQLKIRDLTRQQIIRIWNDYTEKLAKASSEEKPQ